MNESENNSSSDCYYAPQLFLEFKLFTVAIFGSTIALIGLFENIILFFTFISSKDLRRKNLTYLTCLSACDIFVALSYIGIMSVAVLADYFSILPLFIMWHGYLRIFFTISHITLSSSSFLLVAATVERYLASIKNAKCMYLMGVMGRHRALGVCLAFLLGGVLRGTVFWEIEVKHVPGCEGFSSMYPAITDFARNPYYDAIWRFWTRKITTVFLPFFVLAYCNAAIVISLHRRNRDHMIKTLILYVTVGPNAQPYQRKSRVRAATRMLVMVVTCYLLANFLDVIIAAWEHIDGEALLMHYGTFYAVAADISSLLTVVAGALRLPIYTVNDKSIKREVIRVLRSLYGRLTCEPSMQCSNRKLGPYHKHTTDYGTSSTLQKFLRYQEYRLDSRSNCSTPRPCAIRTSVGTLIMARAYASSDCLRRDTMSTDSTVSQFKHQLFDLNSMRSRTASGVSGSNGTTDDRFLKPEDALTRREQPIWSWESRI